MLYRQQHKSGTWVLSDGLLGAGPRFDRLLVEAGYIVKSIEEEDQSLKLALG